MTSLYWAVQTTTTIGYGDVSMRSEMRWFQILYLALVSEIRDMGRLICLCRHLRPAFAHTTVNLSCE